MKITFFVCALALAVISIFPSSSFCAEDSSDATLQQLTEINKKLDASQKREEQILVDQQKILEEIVKSRKWSFNH